MSFERAIADDEVTKMIPNDAPLRSLLDEPSVFSLKKKYFRFPPEDIGGKERSLEGLLLETRLENSIALDSSF